MNATETPATVANIPWEEMEAAKPGCTEGVDKLDPAGRAGTLLIAVGNGAAVAELARIADAPKASRGSKVKVGTRYGNLSRGKAWGRQGTGSNVAWAEKDGGTVYLTEGRWTVGSDDGFRRSEKIAWKVTRVAGVLVAE